MNVMNQFKTIIIIIVINIIITTFLKRLTRDRNKAIMTHVLVQDCNEANIKQKKSEGYECKVFDGHRIS